MKPGPKPTCQCGLCDKCRHAGARARYYGRNAAAIIAHNSLMKSKRRELPASPEVSDEELDRRAVEMIPKGEL